MSRKITSFFGISNEDSSVPVTSAKSAQPGRQKFKNIEIEDFSEMDKPRFNKTNAFVQLKHEDRQRKRKSYPNEVLNLYSVPKTNTT